MPSVRIRNAAYRYYNDVDASKDRLEDHLTTNGYWPENYHKTFEGDDGVYRGECRLAWAITSRKLKTDLVNTVADLLEDGTLNKYACANHNFIGLDDQAEHPNVAAQIYPDDVGEPITKADLEAQTQASIAMNATTNSEAGKMGELGARHYWFNECTISFYDPLGSGDPEKPPSQYSLSEGNLLSAVGSSFFVMGVGGATFAQGFAAPPSTLPHISHAVNSDIANLASGASWLPSKMDLVNFIKAVHVPYHEFTNYSFKTAPGYPGNVDGKIKLSPNIAVEDYGKGKYAMFPFTDVE